MTYLKKLSPADGIEIYDMLQEIQFNDHGFHNKVYGMSYDQFKEWLQREYLFDSGHLEDWMVPQTSYWLYDDEKVIGYGRIRHVLNDKLVDTSGHIGYAIRSTARGNGYGDRLLTLLLEECKKLGIITVQIGVNTDNLASNKLVAKHGGMLIRSSDSKNFYQINME